MMSFRTELISKNFPFKIDHTTPVMFLGSCFSDHIGTRMADRLFDVEINPFGQLYNPLSIKLAAELLTSDEEIDPKMIVKSHGLYHSLLHHTRFSASEPEELLKKINTNLGKARRFLKEASVAFITLGSAICYRYLPENIIAANCHKLPAQFFDRFMLTTNETANALIAVIDTLRSKSPQLRVALTVSPIRHLADGFEQNSLSKATLRLGIEEAIQRLENAIYFPSYEIMNDDLRDYRFYAADMCHPSEQAADYIFEKFSDSFFSKETCIIAKQCHNFVKFLHHRPLSAEGEADKAIESDRLFEALIKKWPETARVAKEAKDSIFNRI